MSKKHNLETDISIDSLISDIETRLNESVNEEELEEGKIKNAALAALLGLGTYAGLEATDMDNTPLAQAMEKAAEQGDEYAEKELDKLTLYMDAGDTRMIRNLSNKYLGPYNERDMNEGESPKKIKDLELGDNVIVDGKMGMFYGTEGSDTIVKFPDGAKVVKASEIEIPDVQMDEDNLTEKDEDDPCWSGYEQIGTKMQDGEEVPNCVPIKENKTMKEEDLIVAMKDNTIAESMGMSSQEARNVLRSIYGYDDLAIARAQLDETTSAGSVAAVSAPIGDTKKRSIYGEEKDDKDSVENNRDLAKKLGYDPDEDDYEDFLDMVNSQDMREAEDDKDSEFDSAWFYKSVDGEVEGPYKAEKEATAAANNYADWVKQGSELEDSDRRLAKRAFMMKSSLSESRTVNSFEKKFRAQLNEAMNVNVSVDPKQPESRNITVTASEQEADELAGLLSNAGMFSSPGYGEVQFQEPEMPMAEPKMGGCGSSPEMAMEEEDPEYTNSPDEKYQDMKYMLDVVSGGLNREKGAYDNAEDGDNPMAVVREEMETAVGNMDEFYDYVMDFYGPGGIYDFNATEEEIKKATEVVKNKVGDDFEGDSVDREKVRDVILNQMRSEEERKEADKAFEPKDVDYDKIRDMMSDVPDSIQTRADVDYDFDSMRNFNEESTNDIAKLAGLGQ